MGFFLAASMSRRSYPPKRSRSPIALLSDVLAYQLPENPTPLEELNKDEKLPVEKRPLFALDQVPRVEGALIAMSPHTRLSR